MLPPETSLSSSLFGKSRPWLCSTHACFLQGATMPWATAWTWTPRWSGPSRTPSGSWTDCSTASPGLPSSNGPPRRYSDVCQSSAAAWQLVIYVVCCRSRVRIPMGLRQGFCFSSFCHYVVRPEPGHLKKTYWYVDFVDLMLSPPELWATGLIRQISRQYTYSVIVCVCGR